MRRRSIHATARSSGASPRRLEWTPGTLLGIGLGLVAAAWVCESAGAEGQTPKTPPRGLISSDSYAEAAAALRGAVESARHQGPDAMRRLAGDLGRAGGTASADALVLLLEQGEEPVRVEALRAAKTVGLRHPGLRRLALADVGSRDPDVRTAALEALGRIGDGRDVPLLLECAAEGPGCTRRAAFRALRALTGASAPYDAERWRYIWRDLGQQAERSLLAALEALERGPARPEAVALRTVIRRLGWADLPRVEAYLLRWFVERDRGLRALACELSAELRLVRFVGHILDVRRFDGTGELEATTRGALETLGLEVPSRKPR